MNNRTTDSNPQTKQQSIIIIIILTSSISLTIYHVPVFSFQIDSEFILYIIFSISLHKYSVISAQL